MEFWIARDRNGLYLFDLPPIKRNRDGDKYYVWENLRYIIDYKLFPEVTFENSPQKIKIELTKEN